MQNIVRDLITTKKKFIKDKIKKDIFKRIKLSNIYLKMNIFFKIKKNISKP